MKFLSVSLDRSDIQNPFTIQLNLGVNENDFFCVQFLSPLFMP